MCASGLKTLTLTSLESTGGGGIAWMDALTVGAGQVITLSGATLGLSDVTDANDPPNVITPSITNNGTLKIEIGQSSKLVIPVAQAGIDRAVQVSIWTDNKKDAENHTVRVSAGATSIEIESKAFIEGASYNVQVSDQCVYESDKDAAVDSVVFVPVALVPSEVARNVDISIYGEANGNKVVYTFKNRSVTGTEARLKLNPSLYYTETETPQPDLDKIKVRECSIDGLFTEVNWNENDGLTLTVGEVAADTPVTVKIEIDEDQYLTYTFTASGTSTTVTLPTDLVPNTQYAVVVTEAPTDIKAVTGGLADSHIRAEDVVNNDRLVVASRSDSHSIKLTGFDDGSYDRSHKLLITVIDSDGYAVETFELPGSFLTLETGNVLSTTVSSDKFVPGGTYTAQYTDTYTDGEGEHKDSYNLSGTFSCTEVSRDAAKLVVSVDGSTISRTIKVAVVNDGRDGSDSEPIVLEDVGTGTDGAAPELSLTLAAGATYDIVVKDNATKEVVYTRQVTTPDGSGNVPVKLISSNFTSGVDYWVETWALDSQGEHASSQPDTSLLRTEASVFGTAPTLTLTGITPGAARTLKVRVTSDDEEYVYYVPVGADATTATIVSDELTANSYDVSFESGIYSVFVPASDTETVTASVASGALKVGQTYEVIVEGTTSTQIAETLSTFTSTGTVTNNGTLEVIDATFAANAVVNNENRSITVRNSKFTVGTWSDGETPEFTGGTLANNGTITVGAGKSTLTIGTLAGSNARIELLDGAEIVDSTITSGGTLNVADSTASVAFTGANSIASAITRAQRGDGAFLDVRISVGVVVHLFHSFRVAVAVLPC